MINNNETLNKTEYEYIEVDSISNETSLTILIILGILFIIGILLNAISILAILSSKKLEIITILILNLAFADIVYLTGIPFFSLISFSDSWPFGLNGCRIFYLVDYIGMTVGVYSIAALSFERFLVVTDNKNSLEKLSDDFKKTIVFIYISIIWLIGVLISLPLLNHIKLSKAKNHTYSCELDINENKHNIIIILRFILIFLIPFTIILISSIKLIVFLRKRTTPSMILKEKTSITSRKKSLVVVSSNKYNQIQRKAINIVLSIVLMFLIQWLPFRIGIYFNFKLKFFVNFSEFKYF